MLSLRDSLTIDSLSGPSDDEPLTLPPAWTPPPRPPFPIIAAIVPVVGAVALWLVTGSMLTLWLALLGPLIAAGTMLDARRGARRDARRAAAEASRARERVSAAVTARHEAERAQLWARHPDVARFLARDDDIWRGDRAAALVVGEGERGSSVRVTGGEGDPDAAAVRRRAGRVSGAPVVAPIGAGIAVVGGETVAAAVQRALLLQLCLALAPGELRLVGPLDGDLSWAEELPHRAAHAGTRLAVVAPGGRVPADADIAIARCRPGEPLPPRCAAVLTVGSPDAARLEHGGETTLLRVEGVGQVQAQVIAAELAARAERILGLVRSGREPVALAPLLAASPAEGRPGLAVPIGVAGGEPAVVDLVADGPHAVVAGVTGSGKSELLITWILALCATRSADDVTFLLADFKGGTAFDGLMALPHVTGVITDLDGAGARRAIESLRAELRHREATIAAAGARDIHDPRVALPRLVVVVDEFAALLGDHPELHALFADVAARGRALGIHLVLGTQRAAGVIRESLLANCPLRISLRVTDPSDSRALLGTDEAALLPGGVDGRGRALVRRAGDSAPQQVTIALSGPDDVATASARTGRREARRPWLPALPARLPLEDLVDRARDEAGEAARREPSRGLAGGAPHEVGDRPLLLGLADEPERQRQPIVALQTADRALLVLGGPGSGVSNVLDVVSAQAGARLVRVPRDLEGMWDAVAGLAATRLPEGAVVVIDDLDGTVPRFAPEYAQVMAERIEHIVRCAPDSGAVVVAAAHRLAGSVSRLADLFPRRLILAYPTRTDHAAAGGDPSAHEPGAPAGRGRLDGRVVQIALAPRVGPGTRRESAPWLPSAALTGFVARRSPACRDALAAWERRGVVVRDLDAYVAEPVAGTPAPVVVVGEPDDWQRHWRVLADVRGDHDLVVDSSCAAELRVLAGFRGVPPYCEPGRGRAWLMGAGADPKRIVLPGAGAEAPGTGANPAERGDRAV
ncbi:FtsK/SpoIIIE domain-containing protein [Microbacterium cremeum]|uniref:FtsK/SpoIIIE domain-containing protein n=1 Tax=Microbacterium cremeum TaxID=2782169 RepID=UPI0018872599|nr:FtsK/SpoIIIE domain-containing protein [Microbacterium cremeum]